VLDVPPSQHEQTINDALDLKTRETLPQAPAIPKR
jgi:hypothetical protein